MHGIAYLYDFYLIYFLFSLISYVSEAITGLFYYILNCSEILILV